MLKEQHIHETVWPIEAERARRDAALLAALHAGSPRRSLAHAAARSAGRALIGLGARLLSFGGESVRTQIRAARAQADLVHYPGPSGYSRN